MQQMVLPADGSRRQFEPVHVRPAERVLFCINADERRYGPVAVYQLCGSLNDAREPLNACVDMADVRGDVRVRLLVHGAPVSLETDDYEAFLLALTVARNRVHERHAFVEALANGALLEPTAVSEKTNAANDTAAETSPVR